MSGEGSEVEADFNEVAMSSDSNMMFACFLRALTRLYPVVFPHGFIT